MNVPESLDVTTLGDVLGTLHRAVATGRLDVIEGPSEALCHRVYLVRGLVDDVEIAPQRSRSAALVDGTLSSRLNALFDLPSALLRFDALRKAPTAVGSLLTPREFLTGRPRCRDRQSSLGAYRVLGLEPGADAASVKHAFRKLALAHHPDRHPAASSADRKSLSYRFSELSAAYHALRR